jgi:hypothetical protein
MGFILVTSQLIICIVSSSYLSLPQLVDIQYPVFNIYDPFMTLVTLTTIDDPLRPFTIPHGLFRSSVSSMYHNIVSHTQFF